LGEGMVFRQVAVTALVVVLAACALWWIWVEL
jgi:hypothetical protein